VPVGRPAQRVARPVTAHNARSVGSPPVAIIGGHPRGADPPRRDERSGLAPTLVCAVGRQHAATDEPRTMAAAPGPLPFRQAARFESAVVMKMGPRQGRPDSGFQCRTARERSSGVTGNREPLRRNDAGALRLVSGLVLGPGCFRGDRALPLESSAPRDFRVDKFYRYPIYARNMHYDPISRRERPDMEPVGVVYSSRSGHAPKGRHTLEVFAARPACDSRRRRLACRGGCVVACSSDSYAPGMKTGGGDSRFSGFSGGCGFR